MKKTFLSLFLSLFLLLILLVPGGLSGQVDFVPQDGFYETIGRDAFNQSLTKQQQIESRYNHSADHVLGRTDLGSLQVWTDEKGLRYRVRFNPDDPDHQKVKAKIASGLIKGSSFSFFPKKVRFDKL